MEFMRGMNAGEVPRDQGGPLGGGWKERNAGVAEGVGR